MVVLSVDLFEESEKKDGMGLVSAKRAIFNHELRRSDIKGKRSSSCFAECDHTETKISSYGNFLLLVTDLFCCPSA